jgi:hypothetical protein
MNGLIWCGDSIVFCMYNIGVCVVILRMMENSKV